MKLILPPTEIDTDRETRLTRDCVVCGATPHENGFEYRGADGMISMSIDDGICLECGVLVFRAARELYPDQLEEVALSLLARYSYTKESVMRQIVGQIEAKQ